MGFENTGSFEVVCGIDVLPQAIQTFSLNHASARGIAGDIRAYDAETLGDGLRGWDRARWT